MNFFNFKITLSRKVKRLVLHNINIKKNSNSNFKREIFNDKQPGLQWKQFAERIRDQNLKRLRRCMQLERLVLDIFV